MLGGTVPGEHQKLGRSDSPADVIQPGMLVDPVGGMVTPERVDDRRSVVSKGIRCSSGVTWADRPSGSFLRVRRFERPEKRARLLCPSLSARVLWALVQDTSPGFGQLVGRLHGLRLAEETVTRFCL